MELNKYIDHTLLKATATPLQIEELCSEAKEADFYAVCVNSCYVSLAKKELKNTNIKIATVVGFPLGAMSTAAKVAETEFSVSDGADEIDMVLNIGWLKSGKYDLVQQEIAAVKEATGGHILKVILETCYLTDEEKKIACGLALQASADFVKTSTGFGTAGATLADVKLMKSVVGDKLKIKASGGIKDRKTAEEYISAGADRLGTSSGIAIVNS